ncbi:transposase [Flammeovirgaceae bacterium SG7u.132]|nr:transposase [Flammeovirgaceae bacterium SG7u.132]
MHKVTEKNGEGHHSDRFYMSDLFRCDAKAFHTEIRGHWTIENSLHWVKDVVHNEDKNRIVSDNGPVNSAVFSSIAINIHRKFGSHSITESQVVFNTNIKELFSCLRT